jgi:hypothetical protein
MYKDFINQNKLILNQFSLPCELQINIFLLNLKIFSLNEH